MAKTLFWVFCLLGAVMCMWHTSAPAFAGQLTFQELGIIRNEIESLEDDISRWKSEASTIEDRAKRYEKLADDAKEQIKQSTHQADKNHWQDTVDQRLQRAKNLRQDAAQILKQVKSKETELSFLRKKLKNQEEIVDRDNAERQTIPDTKTAFSILEEKKGNKKRFPIDLLVGAWESMDDKDLFVIVPQNPDDDLYAGRMEAHTENRVWEGRYHPEGEIDAPSMMTFTYKPKAEEINKDIPKWAREQIEGELEWTLELHQAGTWGTPRFEVKFFPGEVEWNEKALVKDGKNAWVTGKGTPRNINYKKVYSDVYSQTYGAPEIFIRMPGETDPQKNHVEAIIKIQPFFIDVVLPADMAKEQGKHLTVEVENIDTGDTTTLDLKAGVSRKSHSVHYTHDTSVLLARFSDTRVDEYKAPKFSWNWLTGNMSPGKRLDLSIEDGQSVAFKFKGAEASAPFYNSWFQRGIARHVEAVPKMRATNAYIAGNSSALYHPEVRKEATRKLTMIKNYESIVLNADLHDRELYAVGEKYFGLKGSYTGLIDLSSAQIKQLTYMNEGSYMNKYMTGNDVMEKKKGDQKDKKNSAPEEKMRNGLTDKTRDGNNEGHAAFKNVVWTSQYERALIRSAVDRAEKEARDDAVKELPLAIAYAMYTGIASASNADAAYLWIFGEDLQGKKAGYGERLGGAASLFLGQLVSMKMPTMMTMPNTNIKTVGMPKRLSAKSARIGRRVHFKEQMKLKQSAALRKLDKNIKSISDGQLKHIISDANLPIGPSGKVKDWNTPRKNIASKNVKKFEDLNTALPPPKSAPPPTPSLDNVKATYQKNQYEVLQTSAKKAYGDSVKTSEPYLAPQETNMCNCRQADPAFKKYLKRTFTDKELFKIMVEYDIIHPPMTSPLEFGVSDLQVMQLMHKMGFEVKHIPSQKAMPPEVVDQFLKAGWHVRDVVKPKGQIGEEFTHAVQVQNFKRNAKGDIEDIEFYDSAYGAKQTMPYEDYKKVAEDGYGLILYRWPENGKPPAAVKGLDTVAAKAPPRTRKLPERLDLDEALKRLYPNNDYPPLHVTDLKNSNAIINEGQLDLSDQGASFSQGGAVGVARDGGFAVRVKPESLVTRDNPNGAVELYDEALGKGKRATFWPKGKSAGGKGYSSHIPTEHLQFLDTSTNKWRNFPEASAPAPAHPDSDLSKADDLKGFLKELNVPQKVEAVESLDDFEVE